MEVEPVARLTQAEKMERDNELVALDFFEATLSELPDPRRPQGVRYPLRSVVVIALMATVCGCDDAEAMQLWGEHNADWLSSFIDLPHRAIEFSPPPDAEEVAAKRRVEGAKVVKCIDSTRFRCSHLVPSPRLRRPPPRREGAK